LIQSRNGVIIPRFSTGRRKQPGRVFSPQSFREEVL